MYLDNLVVLKSARGANALGYTTTARSTAYEPYVSKRRGQRIWTMNRTIGSPIDSTCCNGTILIRTPKSLHDWSVQQRLFVAVPATRSLPEVVPYTSGCQHAAQHLLKVTKAQWNISRGITPPAESHFGILVWILDCVDSTMLPFETRHYLYMSRQHNTHDAKQVHQITAISDSPDSRTMELNFRLSFYSSTYLRQHGRSLLQHHPFAICIIG
jgi:hypothetical protein